MPKASTSVLRKPAPPVPGKQTRAAEVKQGRGIKFERVTADIDSLVAPRGFRASVLLRFVGLSKKDGHRHYSMLAMIGQNDTSRVSLCFKFTGEETVRFDLPDKTPLSAASLAPALQQYVKQSISVDQQGLEPPIIDD